jgi:hypothetical protein
MIYGPSLQQYKRYKSYLYKVIHGSLPPLVPIIGVASLACPLYHSCMYQSVSMQLVLGMGGIVNERNLGHLVFPSAKKAYCKK